jgi:putative mRNA 3-end processing factor
MSGEPITVRMGNGVELHAEECFHFDAGEIGTSDVYAISHAHSDHLPQSVQGSKVVCSDTTLRCALGRTRKFLEKRTHPSLELLDAGHMAGSSMFLYRGEKTVLYTGDIYTRSRLNQEGAKPVKTDILIIESTYGKPRYVFPPAEEMVRVIKDWVEDTLSQNLPVALFAYPLGKSQDLIHMFDDLEPYVHQSVLNATRMVEGDDHLYHYRPYPDGDIREPFVMICPTQSCGSNLINSWKRKGMRTAGVSGWAIESSYKYRLGVDEAFIFSDHADFQDLMRFVKDCDPSLVLTHHGFAEELATEIRRKLGIDARPLVQDQRSILEF